MKSKTIYDDVFGRSRFEEVSGSFPLHPEDYSDIFGGFSASSTRVSSIPVLELPSSTFLEFDPRVPSSAFEYADIFRGFSGHDSAVSFDELVKMLAGQSEGRDGLSSSESNDDNIDAWISSESEYVSERSGSKVQPRVNGNAVQSHLKETESSIFYDKASQSENRPNGMPFSTTMLVNPENSGYIDRNQSLLTREDDYLPYRVSNGHLNAEFCGKHMGRKTSGKKKLNQVNVDVNGLLKGNNLRSHKEYPKNLLSTAKSFVTVSDVSLKTQPLSVPPPGRPAPEFSAGYAKTGRLQSEETDNFQAYCDFEIDGNTEEAASTFMKEAMKQAELKLKCAKELIEKRKGSEEIHKNLPPTRSNQENGSKVTRGLCDSKARDERLRSTINSQQYGVDLPEKNDINVVKRMFQIAQYSMNMEHCPTAVNGNNKTLEQRRDFFPYDEIFVHPDMKDGGGQRETLKNPSNQVVVQNHVDHSPFNGVERRDQSCGRLDHSDINLTFSGRSDITDGSNCTPEGPKLVIPLHGSDANKVLVGGNKDVILESEHTPTMFGMPEVAQNVEWVDIKFQARQNYNQLKFVNVSNHKFCKKLNNEEAEKAQVTQNELKVVHARAENGKTEGGVLVLEKKVKSVTNKSDHDGTIKKQRQNVFNEEHKNRLNATFIPEKTGRVQNNPKEMEPKYNEDVDPLCLSECHRKKENGDFMDEGQKDKLLLHEREDIVEVSKVGINDKESECRTVEFCGRKVISSHEKNASEGDENMNDGNNTGHLLKDCVNDMTKIELKENAHEEATSKPANREQEIDKNEEEIFTKENIEGESRVCSKKTSSMIKKQEKSQDDSFMGDKGGKTKDDIVLEIGGKKVNGVRDADFTISSAVEKRSDGMSNQETYESVENFWTKQGNFHNVTLNSGSANVKNRINQFERCQNSFVHEAQLPSKKILRDGAFASVPNSDNSSFPKAKDEKKRTEDLSKPSESSDRMNCEIEVKCEIGNHENESNLQEISPVELIGSSKSKEQQLKHGNSDTSINLEIYVQEKKIVQEKMEKVKGAGLVQSAVSSKCRKSDFVAGAPKENSSTEVPFDTPGLSETQVKEGTQKKYQAAFSDQSSGKQRTHDGRPVSSVFSDQEKEQERLKNIEEERERKREREKDRMEVDRSSFEVRANKESRDKAERAIVEKIMNEARERLERACADAREQSLTNKANSQTKTRVDRTFHEVYSERNNNIESSISSNGIRLTPSCQNGSNLRMDRLGVEDESPQRCKARLERHRRIAERAAQALAEKNKRDLLAQKENADRNRLADTLDADVKRWSNGKEGNLRALLSTLHYILGPDSGWQAVPLTDVITAAGVKKAYRKATLSVHPDKLQQRGASIQQKYICEKVFDLLKDSWSRFNSEER